MEKKAKLRKRIIDQRRAMSTEDMYEKSTALFERLCSFKEYANAKVVLVYMDNKNEVMTGEFIKRCKRDGKRVVLPKVEGINGLVMPVSEKLLSMSEKVLSMSDKVLSMSDKVLSVYEINDVESDTLPGFMGIREPIDNALNRLDPVEIDLAVIPGVAFDDFRHRVGYGAGYYDRFLPRLRPDCLKVGVAYSLQMVVKIPVGKYDIPMDIVLTEDKII